MSKSRPRDTGPTSPDAKHQKTEEHTILDEIRLMKEMATKNDLESMCAGLVTKADFESFKKEQKDSIKDEVREEVQKQLHQVTTRNNAFMEYINQRMIEDVKLKAKIDGIPANMSPENLLSHEALKPLTRKCKEVEIFKSKSGEGMGKAMLTFESVKDRQAAVAKSRELKLKVEDRNVYLNNAETEVELKKNKALRQAFSELKQQWQGDKTDIKIYKKEGQIKIRNVVVAERDETSWQVNWGKPKGEIQKVQDLDNMKE